MNHKNYKGRWGQAWRWLVVLALPLALSGCLHLAGPQPRAAREGPFRESLSGGGPAREEGHLAWWLATALPLGLGLGWRVWARRRRRTPASPARRPQAALLDREDLALLRTARDALGFFMRKHLGRMRVVSMAAWRRLNPSSKMD